MEVRVQKLLPDELARLGVYSWPVWEKEVSRFDWHYDTMERCYLLEGSVVVETESGQKVSFGKGDFVTFPAGLSCVWEIKKPVKKHYSFG
jgi:hypothetical protein